MSERETIAERAGTAVVNSRAQLEAWRKEKNYQINNVQILLAVTRGQIEIEISDQEPTLNRAVLLTESVITKLNNDIGVRMFSTPRKVQVLTGSILCASLGNLGKAGYASTRVTTKV